MNPARSASAVGFDLGDTLCEYAGVPLDWEREYPAALAAVAARCGRALTPERLESGTRVLLRFNTRRTPRLEEREFTAEHIFRALLEEWGASEDALAGSITAFFEHFRQTLRAFPESADVLAKLHERGVPTGVLTDVPYGMPRDLVLADLAQVGLPIRDERLFTSTTVGHRKPHPAGFRALARALGVSCERLLYVGNERKDVVGGTAAGCQTVLLWRSGGEAPDWGQAFTIRSLEQIPPLVSPVSDNPWLKIPAADYEGHMRAVGQSSVLRELFNEIYAARRARRVVVLGCTTGSDLEALDAGGTQLAVGVDVNAGYLEIARGRLGALGERVKLIHGDVLAVDLPPPPFDLVHAALLLEHVEPLPLFRRIREWLAPDGVCSVITQEPSASAPAVSQSDYASLQLLDGRMSLRTADEVTSLASHAGLRRTGQRLVRLASGKSLALSLFQREGAP